MKPDNLAGWLSYLEQLHPTAIDLGLERCRLVAERLGLGRLAPRVLTITGTNGKGSTATFLSTLLAAQGLRVGLYTSPHLLRYNERVQIGGQEVTDEQLCKAFERVEEARGEVSLTYFEMGTLAAFCLFQEATLDAVVLEVGLGGRLDAVNLADADVAVVTSIGLDHGEWLGYTRDSVALEKAGIFRPGKPVVCGDPAPPKVLFEQAEQLSAPLFLAGRDFLGVPREGHWHWQGSYLSGESVTFQPLPLMDLPMENAAVALQALLLLDLPCRLQSLQTGLQAAHLSGRLESRRVDWQGESRQLLLDVAHNPHAAEYLARRLCARPLHGQRRAVFGLLSDKDLDGVLAPLLGLVQHWAVAPLPTERSRSAQSLAEALLARGASVTCHASIAEALEAQCQTANMEDEILVFGSFYSVADALEWLAGATQRVEE